MTAEETLKLQLILKDRSINLDSNMVSRAIYKSNNMKATIYDRLCLLSEYELKGAKWNKEVTVVDWGYGKKLDFRRWANDYSACSKGISVPEAEASHIFETLKTMTLQ